MFIQGQYITLRALEPTDVKLLYQWENDPAIWKLSQTVKPYSEYTLQMFVDCSAADLNTIRQVRMMVDLKPQREGEIRKTVGIVDIFDYDPFHQRAGIGILIHADFRGKGHAKEALELTKTYLFDTLLLHQIYCNIEEENQISLSLFQKSDFEIIGLQKDWLRTKEGFKNVYLLQCINQNHETK
jgi:diamine N-acetyltransferase